MTRHLIGLLIVAGLILLLLAAATGLRAAECGLASWYGPGFHGKKTVSGVRYDQNAMTAAHKTLPMGTRLKVTDQLTRKSIRVTINDRGPFIRGRIIDLSKAAATRLGTKNAGIRKVCIERI